MRPERARKSLVGLLRLVGLVAFAFLSSCHSPKRFVKSMLESAVKGTLSGYDTFFRLGICGWDPAAEMQLGSSETTLDGNDDKGTAETSATFVMPAGSKTSSLRCEGRVAYSYLYVAGNAGKHGEYLEVKSLHRIGAEPAILADVKEHATKLDLDTKTKAFTEEWTLPDGTPGVAYRLEISDEGNYAVKFGKRYAMHEDPRIAVFQKNRPIANGDDFGKRGFFHLAEGTAWFLLAASAKAPEPVELWVVVLAE